MIAPALYNENGECLVPDGYELALRMFPMPADLNPAGDVFGGWVLSNVDVAGAIPASRRCGGFLTTKAFNSFQFNQPIRVGDLVTFYSKVVKEGKTSLTVDVRVIAERRFDFNPDLRVGRGDATYLLVTDALVTYVAVDKDGNKRELPPLTQHND